MRRRLPSFSDDDASLCSASTCSSSSVDEDEVNVRMAPDWCAYRYLIERRGFRLDTCRDVKLWYQHYWAKLIASGESISRDYPGYRRACIARDENELCKDAGLVSIRTVPRLTGILIHLVARELVSRNSLCLRHEGCHQSCTSTEP